MKIELSDPLANDEHTAADGVYSRLLKARKWLYLVAVAAALQAHGSINFDAIPNATAHLLSLKPKIGRAAILAALTPLIAQYLLLMVQLAASYRVIVRERLLKRRDEAFSKALGLINGARASMQSLKDTLVNEEALLRDYQTQASKKAEEINRFGDLAGRIASATSTNSALKRGVVKAKSELTAIHANIDSQSQHNERRRAEISAAEAKYSEQQESFLALRRDTPEDKISFRISEYTYDAIRLALPLLIAGYAWWALLANTS